MCACDFVSDCARVSWCEMTAYMQIMHMTCGANGVKGRGADGGINHQTNASLISMGRTICRHEQYARPTARSLGSDSSSKWYCHHLMVARSWWGGWGVALNPKWYCHYLMVARSWWWGGLRRERSEWEGYPLGAVQRDTPGLEIRCVPGTAVGLTSGNDKIQCHLRSK